MRDKVLSIEHLGYLVKILQNSESQLYSWQVYNDNLLVFDSLILGEVTTISLAVDWVKIFIQDLRRNG